MPCAQNRPSKSQNIISWIFRPPSAGSRGKLLQMVRWADRLLILHSDRLNMWGLMCWCCFQVYLTVLKHGDSATLDTMLKVRLQLKCSTVTSPGITFIWLTSTIIILKEHQINWLFILSHFLVLSWLCCLLFFPLFFFWCTCGTLLFSSTNKQTCRRRRTASSECSAPFLPPTSSRKSSTSPSRYTWPRSPHVIV